MALTHSMSRWAASDFPSTNLRLPAYSAASASSGVTGGVWKGSVDCSPRACGCAAIASVANAPKAHPAAADSHNQARRVDAVVFTVFLFMNSNILFSSYNLHLRHKGNHGVIRKVRLGESFQ